MLRRTQVFQGKMTPGNPQPACMAALAELVESVLRKAGSCAQADEEHIFAFLTERSRVIQLCEAEPQHAAEILRVLVSIDFDLGTGRLLGQCGHFRRFPEIDASLPESACCCDRWVHVASKLSNAVWWIGMKAVGLQVFQGGSHRREVLLKLLMQLDGSAIRRSLHVTEVGVHTGDTSEFLLSRLPLLQVNLVDPYVTETSCECRYFCSGLDEFFLGCDTYTIRKHVLFRNVTKKMQIFGDRANVHRVTSLMAADATPDSSLDLVFIDADHSYEAVKADIKAWTPKVRAGGYVTGHDFAVPKYPGVSRAVLEEFPAHSLQMASDHVWVYPKPLQAQKLTSPGMDEHSLMFLSNQLLDSS